MWLRRKRRKRMAKDLEALLTDGHLSGEEPEERAVDALLPKYESRQEAEQDPIEEETKIVQKVVEEEYDRYR
ncbi:hypothetical protein [Caldalkalibacillus salinus]|uniref:hypothetical protein n=1 Tax=Caldalkalibacillus salinus TaxID=2803787 RepID=UPI0019203E44|nr:hypothetical protein [Caldalkalibacillus salinus]